MPAGDYYLNKFNGASIDEKIFTAVPTKAIGFDQYLNPVMLDVSLSTHTHSYYLPYTGAFGNIDLGANMLTVDTTTFVVDIYTHSVGIGTPAPQARLHLKDESLTNTLVMLDRYSNNTAAPTLICPP